MGIAWVAVIAETHLEASLPKERVVGVAGARIGMIHVGGPAVGREPRLVARFPACDAVVYGQSHVPEVQRWEGVWILNPGSPTERRKAPSRTMLELRVAKGEIVPGLVDLGRD